MLISLEIPYKMKNSHKYKIIIKKKTLIVKFKFKIFYKAKFNKISISTTVFQTQI